MARIDRLIPPHSLKITDYDAEHMEQFHKKTYKSFLAMRQNIKREYEANAVREIVDGITYYSYYNLENNINPGSNGYELLEWHGMKEESIQEIVDFHNNNDLDRLKLRWDNRIPYNSAFFTQIEPIIQNIIVNPQGAWVTAPTEADLDRTGVTTTEDIAVWDIYFSLNLINITNVNNEMILVIDTVLRQEIIDAVENGDTLPPDDGTGNPPSYIIEGDIDRAAIAVNALNSGQNLLFLVRDPIVVGYLIIHQESLMNKEEFERVSQDNFFDIYAESIFIDWKLDENFFERFFGGLLKAIGGLLNLVLDVLLSTPLFGEMLEFIIEGIASIFGMTLEEARAALIQAVVFIVALYFSIPSGGSSMYAYVEWVSSAYSLGAIAGDAAAATYESPVITFEEAEEEQRKRDIEQMQGELTVLAGREEPIIRINRPEEELRVDGDNNSTYTIFRLD